MNRSLLSRTVPTVLATGFVAVAIAACGGSSSSSTSTTASDPLAGAKLDSAAAAALPAALKGKTLIVASDASYAPMESIASDGKTVVGADADLANAIAKTLGANVTVQNAGFDGIIPGISSGKFNLGMSSFTDNKEREKSVDFVTYLTAGTSFYVASSGSTNVGGLADLCGLTVAVEKGTTQQDDTQAQAKKCPADKKLTVLIFPDQNGANLALSSGRAKVVMADSPVAAWAVKQSNGKFKLSGNSYGDAPYGIAISKTSGLSNPLQLALKALIANGTYKAILDKWGLSQGAINDPKVNGAQG
jgi:polar amino acid transport system substrate-binding protein